MAIVDAIAVELHGLSGLKAVTKGAKRPYALGRIGDRVFGRSVPISGDALDLRKESVPWRLQAVGVDMVSIAIEIFDELGDGGSKKLGKVTHTFGLSDLNKSILIGTEFNVSGEVTGHRLERTAPSAVVPRTAAGTSTRATLRAPNSAMVTLSEVRGLYAPTALGKPGLVRAEARPGYASEDSAGRVYLNTDLGLAWKKDTQLIELTATVTITSGLLPMDAKLLWTVRDADDPTNDDPGFHVQWGPYVDPSDYDGSGKHHGARASDNEGKSAKNPPWEEVPAFKLSAAAPNECKTEIVGGRSKVVFHCPDVAGDNFIIAVAILSAGKVDLLGHQTGLITMWHRIQVEHMRMTSALPMPMAEVPLYFEPYCVQLDCAPERVIPDKPFLAPSAGLLESESGKYVSATFTPRPGWFCVISALEPHPLPALKGGTLFTGRVTLHRGAGNSIFEYIEIPGAHTDPDFAELTSAGGAVGFHVFSSQQVTVGGNVVTRCWLQPHDVQPEFKAADGSLDAAYAIDYHYSPRFTKRAASVTPGGYGMPATVDAVVKSPGALYVGGVSPSVTVGGKDYFAGRTVLFTHHRNFYNDVTKQPEPGASDRMLAVIVHELVHAFGMPHKCGYYDFRAPRDQTCCMNYKTNWMIDDAKKLIPGTHGKTGRWLCGRHLKEVRRVHLEDNKGLNWK